MSRETQTIETKAERAARMLELITKHTQAGRTVHLATVYRITAVKAKHLPQVRVRNGSLEIQCGKRWIDYTYTHLSVHK